MSQREAYREKLEAQIRELVGKIDQLAARADKAAVEAKREYRGQIEDLRAKGAAARARLAALGEAEEGSWEDVRIAAERALGELNDAVDDAVERLA